jgi:ribosomal protein S18 acetylase RimI-like enzyme
MPHIQRLDHRQPAVARQILALLGSAHEQESRRIGARPESQQSVEQIIDSAAMHIGALEDEQLIGVVVVGPDEEPSQLELKWLAVREDCQRRGIARALVQQVLFGGIASFAVTVAANNVGALALYTSLGFLPYRQGSLGAQAIPVVKLRRSAC